MDKAIYKCSYGISFDSVVEYMAPAQGSSPKEHGFKSHHFLEVRSLRVLQRKGKSSY